MGRGFGWLKDPPDPRDYRYGPPSTVLAAPFAPKVDIRPGMPPIYDQLQLGSCSSNATNACVEHAERKATDPDSGRLSRLWTYFYAREKINTLESDSGSFIRDNFKVTAERGVPREMYWPYDIARFRERPPERASAIQHQVLEYRSILDGSEQDLLACLNEGYPFAFGFPVYESFLSIGADGKWNPQPGESIIGYHAVVSVGYDHTSRAKFPGGHEIIRNSWGRGFGYRGHFFVPRGFIAREGWDCWTIRRVER